MDIVPYSEGYFEPLIDFLRRNWSTDHAIYRKQLFDWQYGGPQGDPSASVLLIDSNGFVQGFLGAIPYPFLYQGKVKAAAGLSVWIVEKEIKYSGVGLYLRNEIESRFDVVYAMGLNLATVHYYQKRGYQYYSNLNRYVVPLEAKGYQNFLLRPGEADDIAAWIQAVPCLSTAVPDTKIGADTLAKAYQHGIASSFSLLPRKDSQFWQWRYLDSEGFSYLFWEDEGGIIVFRLEAAHAPGDSVHHGLKCLRLIEILPADSNVWDGGRSPALTRTILSVLAWGREQGCVLADFQISNSRLGHVVKDAGFRLQQETGITNVARLFSPYRENALPINLAYRICECDGFAEADREDTYLVKSDVDMDRPNNLVVL